MLPARGLAIGTAMNLVFVIALVLTLRRYYRRDLEPRHEDLSRQSAELMPDEDASAAR